MFITLQYFLLVTEQNQTHNLVFRAFQHLTLPFQSGFLCFPPQFPVLQCYGTIWGSLSRPLNTLPLYQLFLHPGILSLPIMTALSNSSPSFKASPKHHLLLEAFPDSPATCPSTSWTEQFYAMSENNSLSSEITKHHFIGNYYLLSCVINVYIDLVSPTGPCAHWRWDLCSFSNAISSPRDLCSMLHCLLHITYYSI